MTEPPEKLPARERLLAAATRLFIAHGFSGTPVSRIVREANVTMPVLYYHFGNKLDLLEAVIAARGGWMRADLKVDPDASYLANCQAMVEHALEHLPELKDGLRLRLLLGFESGPEADALRSLVHEQRRQSVAALATLFATALPGASPRRSAWLAEIYLSGVQALALDLVGWEQGSGLQAAKANNLLRTLATGAELPEDKLPAILS